MSAISLTRAKLGGEQRTRTSHLSVPTRFQREPVRLSGLRSKFALLHYFRRVNPLCFPPAVEGRVRNAVFDFNLADLRGLQPQPSFEDQSRFERVPARLSGCKSNLAESGGLQPQSLSRPIRFQDGSGEAVRFTLQNLADGEGFEPPLVISQSTLAPWRDKPLCQPSVHLVPGVGFEPTLSSF